MKHTACIITAFAAAALCLSPASAEDVPPAPDNSFSIVVLPDTQAYVTAQSEFYFDSEVSWILNNRESQKVVFVSHVGDIINRYKADAEWTIARRQMLRLSDHVPFGISVGNHDMQSDGRSEKFQTTFPASLFQQQPWYGGQIKNNANSFQLFSAGGMDFVFLHLECNAPDEVLEWASGVLTQHSDRRAIITTHMYLGPRDRPQKPEDYYDAPKGRMTWHKTHGTQGNTPQQMWEKCFRKHANLFLICCGDQSRTQAMHRSVQGDHGNTVHESLSDYRGGFFRIYRFLPGDHQIQVITYSAHQQQLCRGTKIVPDVDDHQFVLDYRMAE